MLSRLALVPDAGDHIPKVWGACEQGGCRTHRTFVFFSLFQTSLDQRPRVLAETSILKIRIREGQWGQGNELNPASGRDLIVVQAWCAVEISRSQRTYLALGLYGRGRFFSEVCSF